MSTPTNLSDDKIRVSDEYETDSVVGLTDPAVNMLIRTGIDDRYIVSVDDGFGTGGKILNLSPTEGGDVTDQAYPTLCEIDFAQASGTFGFPYNATDVLFNHQATPAPASGDKFIIQCAGGNTVLFPTNS